MPCRDHKGNEYESLTEMAKAYGMNLRTLFMRINRWGIDNIEKCLTEPVRKKPSLEECRCVDPNGKEWSSETKMCRGWHCGYRQFKRKQAAGLPLAECLDGKRAVLTDPKGREFYSWTDMANAWGIDMHTLMMRTRTYHWSLEKALTAPLKRKCRKMTDCEGREFKSLTAFCKFWGVAKRTVRKRLALGMDMKDVLKDSSRMKALREGRKNDGDTV
jgi:hypothetical protein